MSGYFLELLYEVGNTGVSAVIANWRNRELFFCKKSAGVGNSYFVEKLNKCFVGSFFEIPAKCRNREISDCRSFFQCQFLMIIVDGIFIHFIEPIWIVSVYYFWAIGPVNSWNSLFDAIISRIEKSKVIRLNPEALLIASIKEVISRRVFPSILIPLWESWRRSRIFFDSGSCQNCSPKTSFKKNKYYFRRKAVVFLHILFIAVPHMRNILSD